MRLRLAVEFAVRGEARFLSHHDMLRLMERAAARAAVPVKFSQGYHPRPRLMLPLPRPVGVASHAERLVLELTEPVEPAEAVDRLGRQLPEGIEPTGGRMLEANAGLQPAAAEYALPIAGRQVEPLRGRLDALETQPGWAAIRRGVGRSDEDRPIDLKPLIASPRLDGTTLRFTLQPLGQAWARVEEVLGLFGLDREADRARLQRTAVRWK